MELRRELLLIIGILVALNVLLAFGSIGLFVRMGPAIEKILQENVYSIVAAEEVLAEFAASNGDPLTPESRRRVMSALERAQKNVTEAEELPVLRRINEALEPAFQGDRAARTVAVEASLNLILLNRNPMTKVDRDAQRIGSAGAWAAVLVGCMSFALSLAVVRRLRTRLLNPLLELYDVLEAVRHGDRFRRCQTFDAPLEVRQVSHSVNTLLDERRRPGDDS